MFLITLRHSAMAGSIRRGILFFDKDGNHKVELAPHGSSKEWDTQYHNNLGIFNGDDGKMAGRKFIAIHGQRDAAFIDTNTVKNLRVNDGYLVDWCECVIVQQCNKILDAEESQTQNALAENLARKGCLY